MYLYSHLFDIKLIIFLVFHPLRIVFHDTFGSAVLSRCAVRKAAVLCFGIDLS